MTLVSRTITLSPSPNVFPFLPIISPKPITPRIQIRCKNDETSDTSQRKAKQPMSNPSRNPRKKSSYGASRRSAIKKSFTQEQVEFKTPIPSDPVVGIIGGGMSGLVCALYLEKRGIKSTVFDTASQYLVSGPKGLIEMASSSTVEVQIQQVQSTIFKFDGRTNLAM
ncbi:Zeaxanthin epoxidase [Handroanthus impetiginosus]|uniref:Zeaxanthin epoxidase n=1 Tax=Handroanthus impetiginosus TaxID=429701 RepID=A0A2G9GEP4_9LAMI|nr:Zeaxanthin epoxidase [Handroanthus impetiginosus]